MTCIRGASHLQSLSPLKDMRLYNRICRLNSNKLTSACYRAHSAPAAEKLTHLILTCWLQNPSLNQELTLHYPNLSPCPTAHCYHCFLFGNEKIHKTVPFVFTVFSITRDAAYFFQTQQLLKHCTNCLQWHLRCLSLTCIV